MLFVIMKHLLKQLYNSPNYGLVKFCENSAGTSMSEQEDIFINDNKRVIFYRF